MGSNPVWHTNTPGMYTHKVLREGSHLQDRGRDFQKSQNKSSADALETSVQDMQTQRENASLLFKTPCLWYLLWQPGLIKARLLYLPLCLPNPFFMLLYTAMLKHVLTFPSLALTSWWRARLYLLLNLCTFFLFLNTEKRKHVGFPEHFSFLHCFKTGQIIWGEFCFSLGLFEVARAVSEIPGRMSVSKEDNSFWEEEIRILEDRS